MDYENFCKNIKRIKDTLEKYHTEEEKVYKDNIYFLDELMQLGNYRQLSVSHKEFLRELLTDNSTISATQDRFTLSKYSTNTYVDSTYSNNIDKPKSNNTLKNIMVQPSAEEQAIMKFIEEYNNNNLSNEYLCLKVDDKYADSLSSMDVKDWKSFSEKNEITLIEGPREKYHAYKVAKDKSVYFLVPTEAMKESFGGIRVIQNAFPTFFDFDLNECNESKHATLIRPAIVAEKDGVFKLYKDKTGVVYKGILKF